MGGSISVEAKEIELETGTPEERRSKWWDGLIKRGIVRPGTPLPPLDGKGAPLLTSDQFKAWKKSTKDAKTPRPTKSKPIPTAEQRAENAKRDAAAKEQHEHQRAEGYDRRVRWNPTTKKSKRFGNKKVPNPFEGDTVHVQGTTETARNTAKAVKADVLSRPHLKEAPGTPVSAFMAERINQMRQDGNELRGTTPDMMGKRLHADWMRQKDWPGWYPIDESYFVGTMVQLRKDAEAKKHIFGVPKPAKPENTEYKPDTSGTLAAGAHHRPFSGRNDADARVVANAANARDERQRRTGLWYQRFFRRSVRNRSAAMAAAELEASKEAKRGLKESAHEARQEARKQALEVRQAERVRLQADKEAAKGSKQSFQAALQQQMRSLLPNIVFGLALLATIIGWTYDHRFLQVVGIAGLIVAPLALYVGPAMARSNRAFASVSGTGLGGYAKNLWNTTGFGAALPLMGRVVVRIPGLVPALLVAWFGLAAMNIMWEAQTQEQPIGTYWIYAAEGAVSALVNFVILIVNAILYGLAVFVKVVIVALFDIITQLVHLLLGGIYGAVNLLLAWSHLVECEVGEDGKDVCISPPTLNSDAIANGAWYRLNYVRPGALPGCGDGFMEFVPRDVNGTAVCRNGWAGFGEVVNDFTNDDVDFITAGFSLRPAEWVNNVAESTSDFLNRVISGGAKVWDCTWEGNIIGAGSSENIVTCVGGKS